MRIFIEGNSYSLEYVPEFLRLYFNPVTDGIAITEHVGYYNDYRGDVALFIPKVFEPLFAVAGEDFVARCATEGFSTAYRAMEETGICSVFISKFIFIFQLSLIKYKKRCEETKLLSELSGGYITHNLKQNEATEFEVVASLMDFYAKHKDLIKFKVISQSSSSPIRIDWRKTIQSKYPIHDGDNTIYAEYISSFDHQDASDELLIVFYSLLKYFKEIYGYKVEISSSIHLIKANSFERLCHTSKRLLKKIKGKYFDDRFKRLYKLLSIYFDIHAGGGKSSDKKEYLFVKGYNLVFEDMIDYLISDESAVSRLKKNNDGKVIDHLYQFDSLIDDDEIFYIGDSKYYKQTTSFGSQSIYKQFTYAKNIIQYQVNLFNEGKPCLTYRDELTEGYNISPNFFIQAYMGDLNISSPLSGFSPDESLKRKSNYHFSNRVFDRDSLRLCSFKINFLYVLKSYVTAKPAVVSRFRSEVHLQIRNSFVEFYNSEYSFYKVKVDDVEEFVTDNFKLLNGKVYRSSGDITRGNITLGLSSSGFEDDNAIILDLLSDTEIAKFDIV